MILLVLWNLVFERNHYKPLAELFILLLQNERVVCCKYQLAGGFKAERLNVLLLSSHSVVACDAFNVLYNIGGNRLIGQVASNIDTHINEIATGKSVSERLKLNS